MQRIKAIEPDKATGRTKAILTGVRKTFGTISNMLRTMAHSPAVMEGYLNFSDALGRGMLSARLREQIALAVAEANDSQYCILMHTVSGKSVGLNEDELAACRLFLSGNPKEKAALQFVLRIVMTRGDVSDQDVEHVRRAGFSDAEIVEIIAHVGLNIFANYFNKAVDVAIDFPATEK